MATPRWKPEENQLCKFEPSDGVFVTREDWTTWTLSTTDKFDSMEEDWFIESAENLSMVNDKFDYLVAHPTPDVLTSADFQKHVITYFVAHCLEFPVAVDNINPASDGKYIRIYAQLQKSLCSIQSQLSDSCAVTMESIFTEEAISKHPLKQLCIWKHMSLRFHQISQKDCGA
eukprot:3751561-Rhodomonas_salina.1